MHVRRAPRPTGETRDAPTRSKVRFAQQLRVAPTEAEAALWKVLRERAIAGWKFRRQHILLGYIVDFYCPSLMLAIEVDGDSHDGRHEEDERRTLNLATIGVTVLRVRNDEVLSRPEATVGKIEAVCRRIARARFRA